MNKIEILKKAIDTLESNKSIENNDGTILEAISTYVENEFNLNESLRSDLVNAISAIKIDQPQITVNVPEIATPVIPEIIIPEIIVPQPLVTVNVPEIKLPTINVPEPKVTVNVEKPDAPIVNIPPFPAEMRVMGEVGIINKGTKEPLFVQLVDLKGRPYESVGSGGIISQQSSGASSTTVSLVNRDGNYYNSDNPLPITGSLSTSPFATYYASDAVGSVNVVQTVGLTDTQLRASTLDVKQVSGSSDSVNVLTMPAVVVTSITNTIGTNIVDSSGVSYSGSNPLPASETPTTTSQYSPTNSTSVAYESQRVAKATAGTLYSINGYNSSTGAQFIQVHNVAADQADAVVPIVIIRVPATSNFSYSADKFGRFFSTGITVFNSSTGPTLTQQAKDCWFDIQYQ